jgi:AcrR family transcriptional regulator
MPRPSRNTDLRLIKAGRKLLPKVGVSGLSLRQVADEAGVNLGMFHYHFKTKAEYAQHVLQGVYDEFFSELEETFKKNMSAKQNDPLLVLRALLVKLGRFAFGNRDLLASVMKDMLSGERVVVAFLAANAPRHVGLLLSVVEDCQKRGRIRDDIPAPQVLIMAASAIAMPMVIGTAVERAQPELLKGAAKKNILSSDAVELRVDTILRGLMP